MAVSESGFSLIVLAELINFSLLQPCVCVRQELPTAFKSYGFNIHQHFLSSLSTSESFRATVYLQYIQFMPLAILGTSHTPSPIQALGHILNLLKTHRLRSLAMELSHLTALHI